MTKKTVIITLIFIALFIGLALLCGYGIFILYEIVIVDIQERLTEAIAEGIQKGIGSAVNPLNWPKAFLRG